MRIRFTYKKRGKSITEIQRDVLNFKQTFKDKIMNLGDNALEEVKRNASDGKERPTSPHTDTNPKASKSSISDAMTIEKFDSGNSFGWGVGNISELNDIAKHWQVINDGGYIPPSTDDYPKLRGHFQPDQQGLFVKGQPRFPIYPKKAIKAKNYIEKTDEYIRNQIRSLFK